MQGAGTAAKEKQWARALLILSQLYGNPDLPPSKVREVNGMLDNLAAKVIYSRDNWIERPYLVEANDTLDKIADRYRVPALLLARINGIRDPQNLPLGKQLKVLTGPFSAQISVERSELTMMLHGSYAGRFSVVLSDDLARVSDMYSVREKSPPAAAAVNSAGGAANKRWIELASGAPGAPGAPGTPGHPKISVEGANDMRSALNRVSRNTIWLSEQDMEDVYGILSVGSTVIIQR
jgi:LysM repeat protein